MLEKFSCFIYKHKIDLIILFLITLLAYPATLYLPESFGFENGFIENTQMIVLIFGCVLCFMSKNIKHKKFFIFAFLILLLLILREVNYGRTIFFPIPDTVNEFYTWKEIKYGWLAHPLVGLYIASVAFYFLKNKLYLNLIEYIKQYKILPYFQILFMLIGMALGMYAEKALNMPIFEEMGELLFYSSLISIISIYVFNLNNKEENKD